jgi:hypothetical protein
MVKRESYGGELYITLADAWIAHGDHRLDKMVRTDRAAALLVPRQLCSILLFYKLFITLLAHNSFVLLHTAGKNVWDIRVTVNHQFYDLEYDFPESDPLFIPPRAIELIPEADPKHRRRRRVIQTGLLVRLRRRALHPSLKSILLANFQSMDNNVAQGEDFLPERHQGL